MERKIDSSDTTMVSRLNGKGSNGSRPGTQPAFTPIHTMNQTTCVIAKVAVPAAWLTVPAIRSLVDRARSCCSSRLAIRRTLDGTTDLSAHSRSRHSPCASVTVTNSTRRARTDGGHGIRVEPRTEHDHRHLAELIRSRSVGKPYRPSEELPGSPVGHATDRAAKSA